MNLQELRDLVDRENVTRIDLRVSDLLGRWHHFTIPPKALDEDLFQNGSGFDGSSLRGFQEIHESDMLLIPDIETAVLDPIPQQPTIALICDVVDPLTREMYSRDPRRVAIKAEEYMRSTGIADEAFFGPELEFFLFDDVRYQQGQQSAFYYIDSSEAHWNSGKEESPNLGYKIAGKEGYAPLAPFDDTADLRAEIVSTLNACGIDTFVDHHEVAPAQSEIGVGKNTMVAQADMAQWYKYLVRNVTRQHGMVATFMPKPIHGDNGSGMHTHQSLWKGGEPLFYDPNGYAGLSQLARWYTGGLLKHAAAVLAFAAPTTNSYKRLVPRFEAPVNLVYSMRNRSAAIRISTYRMGMPNEAADKRIEFRPPDPTANCYLAFAAMLMAGLDGIQNQIDPGDPMDRNLYDLPAEEARTIPHVPASLGEALDALDADHDFLLAGGVFTQDVLDGWLEFKRNEVSEHAQRPTPYEFELYFND
ncbi:MAG: type I glutamate--ammonia ligase [Chloroflexi bacterium]|nr:type I glutamate--ammonia ligase [Chloroflexota bacterium]